MSLITFGEPHSKEKSRYAQQKVDSEIREQRVPNDFLFVLGFVVGVLRK
jgi:hypothetical protein